MNGLPKYVASTTLKEPLAWSNSMLVEGDVAQKMATLKREPGKDILVFSADLARMLTEQDLVDEYRFRVAPAIAGGGKRLFAEGSGGKFMRLVETKTFDSGVVGLTLRPTGNGR